MSYSLLTKVLPLLEGFLQGVALRPALFLANTADIPCHPHKSHRRSHVFMTQFLLQSPFYPFADPLSLNDRTAVIPAMELSSPGDPPILHYIIPILD